MDTYSSLPPELERVIFEISALSRPIDIPNLMLIAWRVKEWVEPLLYRIVLLSSSLKSREIPGFPVFTADILLRVIASKPPGFLQNAVRHLLLDYQAGQPSDVDAIFMACNRVTNLFQSFAPTTNVRALQHLQRLAISWDQAFLDHSLVDNPSSFLNNLTHLELLDGYWNRESVDHVCGQLALIPSLTHISFNEVPDENTIFYTALLENVRLHCFVFLSVSLGYVDDAQPLLEDDRLVCIEQDEDFRVDWLRGAHSGEDYWALADAFIAAKRAGRVERTLEFLCSFVTSVNLQLC
ncbi:hypothetical protein B0H13DRAFT_1641286 [Mycena leptocephala]|nr:hypothetical protein B0H13DRAFT_1641286 [Mycena leptocephala]